MRIKILDEAVRQNVEVFLQILRRVDEKRKKQPPLNEQVFRAWLNKETGQLFFAEIAEESKRIGKKDWKPVRLKLSYDPAKNEIDFVIDEAEEKEQVFHGEDLKPIALRVLQKTMKVFGEISQKLKGPSSLDTKMAVLSKLIVDAEVSHGDRNIILDLWHEADRMQAERLLASKPVGAYIFRQDPYAEILREQLEKKHRKTIQCFTLTFSQENRKISDCTVVHVDGFWQVYDDDPSLRNTRFSELSELVASFKDLLKYPLYRQTEFL